MDIIPVHPLGCTQRVWTLLFVLYHEAKFKVIYCLSSHKDCSSVKPFAFNLFASLFFDNLPQMRYKPSIVLRKSALLQIIFSQDHGSWQFKSLEFTADKAIVKTADSR